MQGGIQHRGGVAGARHAVVAGTGGQVVHPKGLQVVTGVATLRLVQRKAVVVIELLAQGYLLRGKRILRIQGLSR